MKQISTELMAHLKEDVTHLAVCWRVKRRDGVVMGFCSHDEDVEYDGVIYLASSGFLPSAVEDRSGLMVDNLEIEGILNADAINEEDVLVGKYDFAEIDVFAVNYRDVSQGILLLRKGWLGDVTLDGEHFSAQMRGLSERLNHVLGDMYSPACRANFSDAKCGLDEASFRYSGVVSEVSNRRVFTDDARTEVQGFFSFGAVYFTSGDNGGLSMEVKIFLDQTIELVLPMPYDIGVGDGYDIVAGCDKSFATCRDRFANAVNFRGEPHLPGIEKLLQTSSTRS